VIAPTASTPPATAASAKPTSASRMPLCCMSASRRATAGEVARYVEAGLLGRVDVTELGHVLLGEAGGRRSDDDVTAFDSTGLAIQDLAIALAALEAAPDDLPQIPV
jgi:alanine dehydrogenase